MDVKEFTIGCGYQLSKLDQLKYLHVTVLNVESWLETARVLAHAAGRVPLLEEFSFDFEYFERKAYFNNFVENYSRLYPGKNLILKTLWCVF